MMIKAMTIELSGQVITEHDTYKSDTFMQHVLVFPDNAIYIANLIGIDKSCRL